MSSGGIASTGGGIGAPTPAEQAALVAAGRQLSMGHAEAAAEALRRLVATNPNLSEAHRLLGLAWRNLGEVAKAEGELRTAVRLAPTYPRATVALAELLIELGRAAEAREALAPFVARPDADILVLTVEANALKALGSLEEAVTAYDRARLAAPTSAVAEHNLAGVLGDLHRFAEGEAAVRRAFDKGLDAPETWLVHARNLQGLGDLDAAGQAYGEAIRRRPAFAEALGDLAQLLWMRTGEVAIAAEPLDRAIAALPEVPDLRLRKARLLEFAGNLVGAYEVLRADTPEADLDPVLLTYAAHLAAALEPRKALAHAERAYFLAPNQPLVAIGLAEAQLAAGAPDSAAATAERIGRIWPDDQHGIGLLAVAWRLLGDPRYAALYDYERMVRSYTIDTPAGWASLERYLEAFGEALEQLHSLRTHPIGQSLRHGTQTQQSLAQSSDPAIRAFFEAIGGPIRRHIAGLGHGDDPLRRRIAAGYRVAGVWSVRLRPSGYHADHLHQKGWLSSACYVALPGAIGRGREGWIKFGEPGVPTQPPLEAEHYVKPEPGLLVLFPSYMWHGTVPFTGDESRLTAAFDLVPTGKPV